VAKDKSVLEKAAIANYVTDGLAVSENPVFSDNERTLGAANEYNQIATGDINQAVANLHTAENGLSAQEAQLTTQQGQAQSAVSTEQAASTQNAQEVQAETTALSQENGEVATLVQQQQSAEAAQAARATSTQLAAAQQPTNAGGGGSGNGGGSGSGTGGGSSGGGSSGGNSGGGGSGSNPAPPPTASGGEGAVQAAESQLGVPYRWAGESPLGTPTPPGPGFDCSGLTAWAWAQVGVGLAHYSGEGGQFSETSPVPVNDLQPGDLLFYGPGGGDHVAMYVGPGTMIEAPDSGNVVHLTALRLSADPSTDYGEPFVGAGRP
jgi:cell wall-associated NlpC family hydrolase